jgi:hypothetical protein
MVSSYCYWSTCSGGTKSEAWIFFFMKLPFLNCLLPRLLLGSNSAKLRVRGNNSYLIAPLHDFIIQVAETTLSDGLKDSLRPGICQDDLFKLNGKNWVAITHPHWVLQGRDSMNEEFPTAVCCCGFRHPDHKVGPMMSEWVSRGTLGYLWGVHAPLHSARQCHFCA